MRLDFTGKKIIKIIKTNNKYQLVFDEGKFYIHKDTLSDVHLFEGLVISEELNKKIIKLEDARNIIDSINSFFIHGDKSEQELVQFLKNKYSTINMELFVAYYKKIGMIDDVRLANDIVEKYNNLNFGELKIIDVLQKKLIPQSIINDINFDKTLEIKKAQNFLDKSIDKYKEFPYIKKKEKIYHFLLSKGFLSEVANEVVDTIQDIDSPEELEKLRKDYGTYFMQYSGRYPKWNLSSKIKDKLLSKGYKIEKIELIEGEYINEMD